MQGIYYLMSIVAMLVVAVWYIRNDRVGDDEPTVGLLAMKDFSKVADNAKRK